MGGRGRSFRVDPRTEDPGGEETGNDPPPPTDRDDGRDHSWCRVKGKERGGTRRERGRGVGCRRRGLGKS